MKIKEIISQNRRDFRAIYICEYCQFEFAGSGYDDNHFHENVIPLKICKRCNQKAPENYRALKTKYPEGFQI